MTITQTIHDQMLAALKQVRADDLNSYEQLLSLYTRAVVCSAIDAAEGRTVRVTQAGAAPSEPFPFMTLTEFRASGREVNNAELEEIAGTDLGHNQGGRVYAHGYLYVEHYADEWCLTIMNDSWTGPLQTLEAILYGYARVEILPRLPENEEMAALCDEWRTFCRDEGLDCLDAGEMLIDRQSAQENATPEDRSMILAQIAYVKDYIQRWDRYELGSRLQSLADTALTEAFGEDAQVTAQDEFYRIALGQMSKETRARAEGYLMKATRVEGFNYCLKYLGFAEVVVTR